MTPEESRAAIIEKVTDLTTQLSGEWTSVDDPNADSCSLPDGSDGVSFSAVRIGPGFPDPVTVTEQARTILEQQGFTVEKREYPKENGRIEMIGSAEGGSFLQVTVNPDRSTIVAESVCVPHK